MRIIWLNGTTRRRANWRHHRRRLPTLPSSCWCLPALLDGWSSWMAALNEFRLLQGCVYVVYGSVVEMLNWHPHYFAITWMELADVQVIMVMIVTVESYRVIWIGALLTCPQVIFYDSKQNQKLQHLKCHAASTLSAFIFCCFLSLCHYKTYNPLFYFHHMPHPAAYNVLPFPSNTSSKHCRFPREETI